MIIKTVRSRRDYKKKFAFVFVVILFCTIVFMVSEIYGITNFIGNPDQNNNQSQKLLTKNTSGSITSSKNEEATTPRPDDETVPNNPVGTFVSNHRPNLDGRPAPNFETSTCTTTPGVKCKISFKSKDMEKSLPVKTTDSNGNASWDWKLQDIGITVGSWEITATAINGDKTSSTKDSILLVVQP